MCAELCMISCQVKKTNNRVIMSHKSIILIPARYASSRFPGKPLALINGRAMIDYLVDNVKATGLDYAVVTDDERIEAHLKKSNSHVVRVDDDVPSGSERIALAYERYFAKNNYDFVINVQGDEPLLSAQDILVLANFHAQNPNFDITTMLKKRKTQEADFLNSNIVKCAFVEVSGECLYFSRSSIPHDRDGKGSDWFQHIGVYCYKAKALSAFVKLPMAKLEDTEKLEQLRALANGMRLGAVVTKVHLIGVDTPQDIAKVEGVLNGQKN